MLPNTKIAKVDMNRQEQIDRFFEGCDCVVNLVGILNERKDNGKGFTYVHIELTSRLIKACKTNGIPHLLQVSSLGADPALSLSINLQRDMPKTVKIGAKPEITHFNNPTIGHLWPKR